jgi:hypothetical protein
MVLRMGQSMGMCRRGCGPLTDSLFTVCPFYGGGFLFPGILNPWNLYT